VRGAVKALDVTVTRDLFRRTGAGAGGLWLSAEALAQAPAREGRETWWWLPPAVFPGDEAALRGLIDAACSRGGRTFVLNDPWQGALFAGAGRGLKLWAGPFCNLANPLALEAAAGLGFAGAIVSPELGGADILSLPGMSPLPLGVLLSGNWPLCVARTVAAELETGPAFISPKGEEAWVARHGPLFWVYPNWRLDLRDRRGEMEKAGYRLFVHLVEPVPAPVKLKQRPGGWNWQAGLE
jgi:putative protease